MPGKYSITADENGSDRVLFAQKAKLFLGLRMRPAHLEPELRVGRWIVLAYAVWSKPDVDSIDQAITAVEQLSGKLRLGVRPFAHFDEFASWCPTAAPVDGRTPVWIHFEAGQPTKIAYGYMKANQVIEWLA